MRVRVALLALCLVLSVPAAARGSLAGEQQQGQDLITQLQARTKTCADLSADDFDHIGEYVMGQVLGSTSVHQTMNDRMRLMLGQQGETRMHQLMGQRYAGCTRGTTGYGGMMGSAGMMGSYNSSGGLGSTISSSDWNWMTRATWRKMTRQQWQHLQQQLVGTNASTNNHRGWNTPEVIAATLGAALVAALAVILIVRGPSKRPPAVAASG
jgi:hypothetical protein